MRNYARQAMIREEVQSQKRYGFSILSKDALMELVSQPKAAKEERCTGDPNYRMLWHYDLSNMFNYTLPGIQF